MAEWEQLAMSREEAEDYLADTEEGCFVIRNSSRAGMYTLTIRQASIQKPCHHVLVLADGTKFGLQRSKRSFPSLGALVDYYSNNLPSEGQLPCKLRIPGQVLDYGFTEDDVGSACSVEGYPVGGTLRFFGRHKQHGMLRCGIELDHPVGKNNGTVGGDYYFSCEQNFGILCHPDKVTIGGNNAGADGPPPIPTGNRPAMSPPVPNSARPGPGSARGALPTPPPNLPPRTPEVQKEKFMFDGEEWWIGMIQGNYSAEYLANGEIGDYIVRESQSTEDCYVLSILLDKGPTEYKIKHEGGMFTFYNAGPRVDAFPTMQLLIDNMVEAERPAAYLFAECPKLRTRFEMKAARAASERVDQRMAEMVNEVVAVPTDFGLESEPWYVGGLRAEIAESEMTDCEVGTFIIVPHINDSYVLLVVEKKRKVKRIAIERMGGVYKNTATNAIHPSLSDVQTQTKACKIPGRVVFDPDFDPDAGKADTIDRRRAQTMAAKPPMFTDQQPDLPPRQGLSGLMEDQPLNAAGDEYHSDEDYVDDNDDDGFDF